MEVDPRRAQLDLAGSLGEKEAAEFVAELWSLMRCGLAAIAGARAEQGRDGQAVAREGGVVVAVAIPPSPSSPRDRGHNQQQQQQYQRGAGRRDYEYDNRGRDDQIIVEEM
ncbi:predicted protein [Thalassiosira pseudonana CCMP1335]|uniref:PWI domain-containing protein n=1 Tax=Thalassiosira pseudonana TaxID=35128 RepID=B8C8W8_THAPS|nr:predicted protein [Thalassiosira pseudonana CCMP1335]EED89948.1 predicted protein [Thalassiosira pseudonana CCMP1335]|eukprot:g5732.t1 g5732   contig20:4317-4649(-)